MSDRVTGPLFKWFGSKWSASKHHPGPRHASIVEPFAGSAGYSLRHHEHDVVLAETDPHLRKLWSWLIHSATEADVRSIPINVAEGTDIRTLGLSDGQALLLKNWQRTNGVGDCWTVSSWGNLPGQWTANTRARVASEVNLIKHWVVRLDAAECFATVATDVTWFIDPPYQSNYQYKSAPLDYAELARTIHGLKGQVIACEAVCPKTGAVPTWLPFEPFRSMVTSRRKASNHHHSKELLYAR